MATTKWRGDAQPVRQISKIQVTNVGIGDTFKVACNRKIISFIAEDETASGVYAGLAAQMGENAAIAEFSEITPLDEYNGETNALWLQGPEDGTPFTVAVDKVNGTAVGVEVITTAQGVPGANCKQTITVTATGGTFTLSFAGVATSGINYNESAANIQTALRGLSSIGSPNVNVTDGGTAGNQRSWVVEFVGPFANATQSLLVANGASLTGVITGLVTEQQKGASATNHKFSLTMTGQGGVAFSFTNPLTGAISYGSCSINTTLGANQSAAIQSTLQSMPTIGTGNVIVTRTSQVSGTAVYSIEFTGTLAGQDLTGKLTADAVIVASAFTVDLDTTQTGSGTSVNEKQVLTFSSVPSGGTFDLTYAGQTASSLAHNITNSALQTALEGLSNIAPGDVTVTKVVSGGMPFWTVEFTGNLAAADQPMMTMTTTSITGGPAYVLLTQEGAAGTNEVQTFELTGPPSGGTYTLTYSGQTTGNIAFDAAPSVVQAALEALSNVANGDVAVSGSSPFYTVTFQGGLAYTNVVELTGDGTNLTGGAGTETISLTSVVSPTGPNWYSEANNWSTGAVPSSGDTIIFEDNNVDCLYGIVPGSIPQSMTIRFDASFTGRVGLPEVNANGYYEYRDKRLRVGDTSGSVTIHVGQGDGDGSSRIRMNTGAATTTIDVWTTGQSDDDTTRAFDWIGTHASNVARVHDGQMAIAPYAGETATIATLTGTSNADILAGPGSTLTAITTAGDLLVRSPLQTSLTITDGTCVSFGSLNSCTINITGGTWEAHNSGTATAVTVGPGEIDCSEDYTAKTFTTLTIKAGSDISDPNKTITATTLARGSDVQEISTR